MLRTPNVELKTGIVIISETYLVKFGRFASRVFLSTARVNAYAKMLTRSTSAREREWPTKKFLNLKWDSMLVNEERRSAPAIENAFKSIVDFTPLHCPINLLANGATLALIWSIHILTWFYSLSFTPLKMGCAFDKTRAMGKCSQITTPLDC
jgi:hypothetical protein